MTEKNLNEPMSKVPEIKEKKVKVIESNDSIEE